MIHKLALTIFLVLFPILCFGQSALLERGENSIGLGGGLSFTRTISARQANLVGSVAGILDIGYFSGKVSINNTPIDASIYGFFGQVQLVRSNETPNKFPANVAVFVQYSESEARSSTTVGLRLFRRIRNKNSEVTLPGITLARTVPNARNQDAVLSYYIEIPMAKRFGENTMLSLFPSFGVADKQTFVSVALGISLILGQNPEQPK